MASDIWQISRHHRHTHTDKVLSGVSMEGGESKSKSKSKRKKRKEKEKKVPENDGVV